MFSQFFDYTIVTPSSAFTRPHFIMAEYAVTLPKLHSPAEWLPFIDAVRLHLEMYDAWSYFDPAGLDNRILPTEPNAASPTYERDL